MGTGVTTYKYRVTGRRPDNRASGLMTVIAKSEEEAIEMFKKEHSESEWEITGVLNLGSGAGGGTGQSDVT